MLLSVLQTSFMSHLRLPLAHIGFFALCCSYGKPFSRGPQSAHRSAALCLMNSPHQMRRMATSVAVGFRAVGSALCKPSRQRKCFPAALRTGKHAQPSKQTSAGTSVHEKNNGRAWSRARHPPTAPPQNADCISVSSPCLNFRRERVPRRFPARSQHEKKESHTPRTQKRRGKLAESIRSSLDCSHLILSRRITCAHQHRVSLTPPHHCSNVTG